MSYFADVLIKMCRKFSVQGRAARLCFFFLVIFVMPLLVAGAPAGGGGTGLTNPLGVDTLEELIAAILGAVVQIGSILLVLALVWTGFLFVKAQGKPEDLKTARDALLWTVIGGLILLGAQAIADVISATVETL